MRADGSIKDMTTGVSTVDKSQWEDTQYMKLCLNMQNSKQEGLVRRPPAELILNTWTDERGRLVTEFEPNRDILLPFEIDYDPYWLYAQLDPAGEWYDHTVHVFDGDGNNIPCDNLSPNYEYFLGVRGNKDVAMANNGDGLYLVNKQKRVRRIEDSMPLGVNQSLVVVHTAPKVHQQIAITWEYPDQTQGEVQYVVGEDHPTQPITQVEDVDNGVNTIADALATKINAQITTDGQDTVLTCVSRGGTIVFERAVPDFSNVIVHDGDNDVLAINGEVANVLELPKYAHNGQIVAVAPEPTTARAAFYMRSELILGDEVQFPLPAPDFEFTAGENLIGADNDRVHSGFIGADGDGQFTTYGTWTGSTEFNPVDYPNANWTGLTLRTPLPVREKQSTTIEAWLLSSSATGEIPANEIQYMELWDTSVNPPKRKIQSFMFQEEGFEPGTGQTFGSWVWRGTVDGGVRLVDGRTYAVYLYDVAASQVAVPEVRWVEESAPDEDTVISSSSFVHALHRRGDGTFEFADFASVNNNTARPLQRRTSGDDTTNPFPVFEDKKIRDVATFQSRLALLADDKVSMSVTGQPHDWFRGTVTQLLDTSPISIQSTAAEATSLRHFVQHNSDLLVFGPAGQFKLDGTTPMSPSTASMPKTASFISHLDSKPVASGNDVFFATDYGTSAGVSRYTLSANIDGLAIGQPLTDNQIDLIPGNITRMVVSPNLGIMAVGSTNFKENIWVMEYEVNSEFTSDFIPAWSQWNLEWGVRVLSMRMNGDYLDIITVGKAYAPIEVTRPECQPYSCSAYADASAEQGISYLPTRAAAGETLAWPFATTNGEVGKFHMWGWYISAPTLNTSFGGVVHEVTANWDWNTGDATPSWCDGTAAKCIEINTNDSQTAMTFADGQGTGQGTLGSWGDYFFSMIFTGRDGGNYVNGEIARNSGKKWRYWREGSGYVGSWLNISLEVYVSISGTTLSITMEQEDETKTTVSMDTGDLGGKWNQLTVYMTSDAPVIIDNDGGPGWKGIYIDGSCTVSLGDRELTHTGRIYRPGAKSSTTLNQVHEKQDRLLYEGAVFFRQAQGYTIMHMGSLFGDEVLVDTERVHSGYERNFANYQQPNDCPYVPPSVDDEGHVRLYRLNLFGNRKTRRRFLDPADAFGDVYLDARQTAAGVSTEVVLPELYPMFQPAVSALYPPEAFEVKVVQGSGCPYPGDTVTYTRDGDVLTLDEDMEGGEVYYGYNFTSALILPEVDVRDASGIIQTDAKLRVSDWHITMTGYCDALVTMDSKYGGYEYPTQEYRGTVIGVGQTDVPNVDRGQFRVQFRQDPNNANIGLRAVGHIAMDLHQAEWRGTYYNSGRRF